MELVYFWVRNYKNIQNQGFNFSGKWEFSYKKTEDGKDGILSYKNLENPALDGFFSKNIVNVTGIVGRNGSGKSSILELIYNEIGYKPNYIQIQVIEGF